MTRILAFSDRVGALVLHGGDSLASGRLQSTSEETVRLLAIDLDEILAGARRREHEAATRHSLGKLLPIVTIVKEQL
jgi:hypothetical protein